VLMRGYKGKGIAFMSIHQVSMQFLPEEDRIILRLNTVQQEAFRFFVTRRYVRVLWPVLLRLLEADFNQREPDKGHVAKDVLDFERQQAMSGANFGQAYAEGEMRFPLGEAVQLLTGVRVKEGPKGGDILCLVTAGGKALEFGVNGQFIHTFGELLKATVRKAGWDLDGLFGGTKVQASRPPGPRVLH
jgi:hypothetical protein